MLIEWLHRIYCKVKSNTMEARNFMSMFCSIHFHFSQNRSSRQEVCNLIKKETMRNVEEDVFHRSGQVTASATSRSMFKDTSETPEHSEIFSKLHCRHHIQPHACRKYYLNLRRT